jgi:hypothetical protein
MNGDGAPDIAVVDASAQSLTVLVNNGNGTFRVAEAFDTGSKGPSSVAAADFDGDGRDDLAVANWESNDVAVFLNRAPA